MTPTNSCWTQRLDHSYNGKANNFIFSLVLKHAHSLCREVLLCSGLFPNLQSSCLHRLSSEIIGEDRCP